MTLTLVGDHREVKPEDFVINGCPQTKISIRPAQSPGYLRRAVRVRLYGLGSRRNLGVLGPARMVEGGFDRCQWLRERDAGTCDSARSQPGCGYASVLGDCQARRDFCNAEGFGDC